MKEIKELKLKARNRIAKYLWKRDASEGQMVGMFEEHIKHWRSEADKIIKIIDRVFQSELIQKTGEK